MRAALLARTRAFFAERDCWEVETPIVSQDVCIDAHLDPFPLETGSLQSKADREFRYLQTSPEFAMKRLLAAGSGSIFQIAKVFRHGESGAMHNPEFTMLEWYRVGWNYRDLMQEVAEYVDTIFDAAAELASFDDAGQRAPSRPALNTASIKPAEYRLLSYESAFQEFAQVAPFNAPLDHLRETCRQHGFVSATDDRDDMLNFLLAAVVEPHLKQAAAIFLHDFPASQAALARFDPARPEIAQRFELYLRGVEICNGYQELTDATELRRRNGVQNRRRRELGKTELPVDSQLLAAMDAGLPECAGVALGFDRLAMLALGLDSVSQLLAFPWNIA